LFYKKLRIKIVVCFLRESGPWTVCPRVGSIGYISRQHFETFAVFLTIQSLIF